MWTYITVSCTSLYARRLMEYDDKKVVQTEMHTFTNGTLIGCARACLGEKYCLSFHFYRDGPTCLTLRERPDSVMVTPTDDVIGYQLFLTDKPLPVVGSDCDLDVDCKSVINTRCHSGSCRCDVGHRLHGNICQSYSVACASFPGYTWDVDSGICYMVETMEAKNWDEAASSCRSTQGNLIQPNTAAKMNLVKQVITEKIWIGAQLDQSEWRWADRTVVNTAFWAPSQPSGDGPCVEIVPFEAFLWNDVRCTAKRFYACEINFG
ncbi:C-type lectin domain family 18 member A-like [Haliotis rubra]|uniref:C-type lectin domain family 18 member A-like n=1 Tax=Haliotis rubra TaxID=36100 RepID=UPI001EE59019|nr:C-type lectin domain family 18 member A-like [Haliotis rubra]